MSVEPGNGSSGSESLPADCLLCGGPATRRSSAAGLLYTCTRCELIDADGDRCQELLAQRQRVDTLSAGAAGEREIATLAALPATPPGADLERALGALASALVGADALRVQIARGGAIAALEGKVKAPAAYVDAALAALQKENGAGDPLAGRPLDLRDPEPWSEPVDGAELLAGIERAILQCVVMPDGGAVAAALWSVHTHALEAAYCSPILGALSPEKRSGKSTLLAILSRVVSRPLAASSISPAALYRTVEAARPTLLLDEADAWLKDSEDLRGLLNAGHTREGAYVVRIVGEDLEPRRFSTWGARAVAGIGRLAATIEDRAVILPMRRRAPGEHVERLRLDRLGHLADLSRKAARWVADHLEELRAADPDVPEALHDRAADNWRPLLAIADAAGGDWPRRARVAALALSGVEDVEDASAGVRLLADLAAILEARGVERMHTDPILAALCAIDDAPWATWRRGQSLDARGLGKLLRGYGVRARDLRIGTDRRKGYALENLADPIARYVPRSRSATARQPNGNGGPSDSVTRDTAAPVAEAEPVQVAVFPGVVAVSRMREGGPAGVEVLEL